MLFRSFYDSALPEARILGGGFIARTDARAIGEISTPAIESLRV